LEPRAVPLVGDDFVTQCRRLAEQDPAEDLNGSCRDLMPTRLCTLPSIVNNTNRSSM
jgi:hypothetical protein